jgi:hypothetical protein
MPLEEEPLAAPCDASPNFDTRARSHRYSFIMPTGVAQYACTVYGHAPFLSPIGRGKTPAFRRGF